MGGSLKKRFWFAVLFQLGVLLSSSAVLATPFVDGNFFPADNVRFTLIADNLHPDIGYDAAFPYANIAIQVYADTNRDGIGDVIVGNGLKNGTTLCDNQACAESVLGFGQDQEPAPQVIVSTFDFSGYFAPGAYLLDVMYIDAGGNGHMGEYIPLEVFPVAGDHLVTGSVVDLDTSVPVENAVVEVLAEAETGDYVAGLAVTGADGNFSMEMHPGEIASARVVAGTLYATHLSQVQSVTLPATSKSLPVLSLPTADSQVEAVIWDANAGAVLEQSFTLTATSDTGWLSSGYYDGFFPYPMSVRSGADWVVTVDPLALNADWLPKKYFAVKCGNPPFYEDGGCTVTPAVGQTTVVDLHVFENTANIGLSVVTEDLQPVEGAAVKAYRDQQPFGALTSEGVTDSQGLMTLPVDRDLWQVGVTPGASNLLVGGQGVSLVFSGEQTVFTSAATTAVELTAYYPDAAIEGRVFRYDGTVATEVVVSAECSNVLNSGTPVGFTYAEAVTDQGGYFSIPALDGNCVIVAKDPQGGLRSNGSLMVGVSSNGDEVVDSNEIVTTPELFLVPESCFNGILDGDEEYLDGGGSCLPAVPQMRLDVGFSGLGQGRVYSLDGHIDTSLGQSAWDYPLWTTVDLFAEPNAQSSFTGWSDPACGTNLFCAVNVDRQMALTADFDVKSRLTVSTAGPGFGEVVSDGLISCPSGRCYEDIIRGGSATLTAVPQPGSVFSQWAGDCTGKVPTCTLTMDGSRNAIALFVPEVVLQQPAAGSLHREKTTTTVQWTLPVGGVYSYLRYSLDGGASWSFLRKTSGAVSSLEWKLPAVDGDTSCLLRVTVHDAANKYLGEVAFDVPLTITESTPQILLPASGDDLVVGGISPVSWSPVVGAGYYILRYSDDGGTSWNFIAQVDAATTYDWRVPFGGTVVVRVEAYQEADGRHLGTGMTPPLNMLGQPVLAPKISLLDVFNSGDTILWNWSWPQAAQIFHLRFSSDGGASWSYVKKVVGQNNYNWRVPAIDAANCLFKLTAHDGDDKYLGEFVTRSFGVNLVPTVPDVPSRGIVAVGLPNGGEFLSAGEQVKVSWSISKEHSENAIYHVRFSSDAGATWSYVKKATSQVFDWTVPSVSSSTCLIKVTAHDGSDMFVDQDISDNFFRIQ